MSQDSIPDCPHPLYHLLAVLDHHKLNTNHHYALAHDAFHKQLPIITAPVHIAHTHVRPRYHATTHLDTLHDILDKIVAINSACSVIVTNMKEIVSNINEDNLTEWYFEWGTHMSREEIDEEVKEALEELVKRIEVEEEALRETKGWEEKVRKMIAEAEREGVDAQHAGPEEGGRHSEGPVETSKGHGQAQGKYHSESHGQGEPSSSSQGESSWPDYLPIP